MNERELRGLIGDVKNGRLSRRGFVQRMMAVGLTAPMATQMLAYFGRRDGAVEVAAYKPTKRGGGGPLKMLWWQGADAAQSAFRGRHQGPGRLAHLLRAAGRLGRRRQPACPSSPPRFPAARTAALAADGKSVTWKLKQGVHWHDGKPFTADDVRLQLGIRRRSGDRRDHHRHLQGRQGREGRRPHRQGAVRQADAVLGRRLRRRARHDHSQAPVRRLHRRQVARRADQPQAGRHRPLQVRRLQAGRHGARRDQPQLPHAEPAVFRHDRDEGRRRRGLGGARRAADRRIRLRLEHAGRGRDPAAPGEGRQGPRRRSRPAATSSTSSSTPPIRGPRSTASARASRPSTRRCRDPAVRQALALLVDRTSVEKFIYGRTGIATANFVNNPEKFRSQDHQVRVQRRQGERDPRRRPAGRRAPTASARRTARS